jgi:histone deacetylase HOS3
MIVERPERILATTLGIATAYVLLGGRYAGAQHPPHPDCSPGDVPFIIRKSNRFVPVTSPAVTNVHGTKWMNELKIMCDSAETKLAMNGKELVRPDDGESDKPPFHEGDLYLCAESLDALEGALGGVLDAVDLVFDVTGPKSAFVGIRPPGHHCSADYPAGFCWLNNVHVAISHAAAVHGLTHAAIIDFDLHHGDGSQAITWAHNTRVASLPKNASFSKRTSIGYFSLHDINSFPCEWGDEEKVQAASLCIENAHGQTVWNTHLQPWKTNDEFWNLYEKRYVVVIDKARDYLRRQTDRLRSSVNAPQPRGMIFISAGFDASEWEGQGMQRHKVNVPTDFYERFTRDIMSMSYESGLGVDGRVVSVLEGGYSDRALTSGVMSHLSGMIGDGTASNKIEHNIASGMEDLSLEKPPLVKSLGAQAWSPSALDELEAATKPTVPSVPKKARGPTNPTYSTPTQSSSAKVHPLVAARRSSSMASEPVPQPTVDDVAPGIGWAVAAHAFSRVLVPNRQTHSCRPEDLNAEATRLRRERQSAIGALNLTPAPAQDAKRMQLRGRKTKAISEDQAAGSNRRTTIEGSEITDLATSDSTPRPITAPRRRVSMASTTLSTTEETAEAPPPAELRRSRRSSSVAAREASAAALSSTASSSRPGSAAAKSSRPGSRAGSPSKARARKTPGSKAPSRAPTSARPAHMRDVDELEAGMKKMSIKLNLGPKPESKGEPKKKSGRAPRKPLAKLETPASTPVSATSTTSMGSPSKLSRASVSDLPAPIDVASNANAIDAATNGASTATMTSPSVYREHGHDDTGGNGTENADTLQAESKRVEADVSAEAKPMPIASGASAMGHTPTAGQQFAFPLAKPRTPETARQRLPVFTSNSTIPFGPTPSTAQSEAGLYGSFNPTTVNGAPGPPPAAPAERAPSPSNPSGGYKS